MQLAVQMLLKLYALVREVLAECFDVTLGKGASNRPRARVHMLTPITHQHP